MILMIIKMCSAGELCLDDVIGTGQDLVIHPPLSRQHRGRNYEQHRVAHPPRRHDHRQVCHESH